MTDAYHNTIEAQFSLIVCGPELSIQEISEHVGLEPTRTIRKGELISRLPEITAQEDAWYHTIQLSSPEGRDPAMLGMLETINNAKEYLKSLIDGGNQVIMRLYVNSDKAVIGYRLMPMTLTALQKIGLPLDVTSVSWGDVGI